MFCDLSRRAARDKRCRLMAQLWGLNAPRTWSQSWCDLVMLALRRIFDGKHDGISEALKPGQ